VSIVVRRGHILLRALSAESAEIVESHLRGMGIAIEVNAPLENIRVDRGAIAAIRVGGRWIACDTLLVAAGTITDTKFLEGTGLLTEGQLITSPSLQTADQRIFAAGDAAVIASSSGGRTSPNTWPQAVSQGRLAAENCCRLTPLPHRDLARINAMELDGLAMVILGPPVEGAEVVSCVKPEEGIRREIFIVGGKAVGGALIGDISAAGPLHALITAGAVFTPDAAELLRPRTRNVLRFPEHSDRRLNPMTAPSPGVPQSIANY
jgi:nitrite reductase (NADH) large subunit